MKYILRALFVVLSLCGVINCSELQSYKLPSTWELQRRFLEADLDDYLYECPDILMQAEQTVLELGSLEASIANTLKKFSKTKTASIEVNEFYNKKIARLLLMDAPHLLARYSMEKPPKNISSYNNPYYKYSPVIVFNGKHYEEIGF